MTRCTCAGQTWSRVHDLTITGGGVIDGQGQQWWDKCNPTCPDGSNDNQRPTLLGLLWVDGLTIDSITLQNSPFWTTHPTFSNNVLVQNVSIFAPSNSRNTDGTPRGANTVCDVADTLIAEMEQA